MRRSFTVRGRVGLILLALTAALAASITIMAMTSSTAFAVGAAGGDGGTSTGGSTPTTIWETGDWGSINEVFPGYTAYSEMATYAPKALSNAVSSCKKLAKASGKSCSKWRIVAVGYQKANGVWSASCSGSGCVTAPTFGCKNIVVQKTTVGTCQKLNDSHGATILSLAQSKSLPNDANAIVFVVVADYQYKNETGWYPTFTHSARIDVASANGLATVDVPSCAAYYYVSATGVDGYVYGKSTTTTTYETPYGKLYDAVQKGTAWKDSSGKSYGPFTGSYADQSSKLKEIESAATEACAETAKMTTKYSYGSSSSKSSFLALYAKGGIYKVVKQQKVALITAKTTKILYFTRNSDWYQFAGWKTCKAKSTNSTGLPSGVKVAGYSSTATCSNIGKSKPGTPSGLTLDPYDSNGYGAFVENYASNDGWTQATTTSEINAVKNAIRTPVDGVGGYYGYTTAYKKTYHTINGRTFSAAFNRGYATAYTCSYEGKSVTVAADKVTSNGVTTDLGDCTPSAWSFTNKALGWNKYRSQGQWSPGDYIQWNTNGSYEFKYGGAVTSATGQNPGKTTANTTVQNELTNQLYPVANAYQSITTVGYQDFVHLNCNKSDFDAYVSTVNAQLTKIGIPSGDLLTVDTDTDAGSTAHSGFISVADIYGATGIDAASELVPRFYGSSLYDGKKGLSITGISIKQTTGQSNPTVDGMSWSTYLSTVYSSTSYDASKDPVYSKECSPLCYANSTTTNTTSGDSIGTTGASSADTSSGATGVRVFASDVNGNVDLTSTTKMKNSANMTFFRSGSWNYFQVDLYAPAAGSTSAGSLSYEGTTAKSTIITRNTDASPWWTGSTKLTTLQYTTGGLTSSSWTEVLSNRSGGTASAGDTQLQTSTTTYKTAYSEQVAGQANTFRIKSIWASDGSSDTGSSKNIALQFKWEYDMQDHVLVASDVNLTGDGSTYGSTSTTDTEVVSTTVDGKCQGRSNVSNTAYPSTAATSHGSTGNYTDDDDDMQLILTGDGYKRGYVTIQFVRSTGE